MIDLTIKYGYYFIIDLDKERQIFNIEVGKAYQDQMGGVKEFSVKVENGFINSYSNGVKEDIRDASISNSFESVVSSFINRLIQKFTRSALLKRNGSDLIPYFEKEVKNA